MGGEEARRDMQVVKCCCCCCCGKWQLGFFSLGPKFFEFCRGCSVRMSYVRNDDNFGDVEMVA